MIIEVSSFIHMGSLIGSAVEQAWVRLKKVTIWNLEISYCFDQNFSIEDEKVQD
jgi:hypothetical protein